MLTADIGKQRGNFRGILRSVLACSGMDYPIARLSMIWKDLQIVISKDIFPGTNCKEAQFCKQMRGKNKQMMSVLNKEKTSVYLHSML